MKFFKLKNIHLSKKLKLIILLALVLLFALIAILAFNKNRKNVYSLKYDITALEHNGSLPDIIMEKGFSRTENSSNQDIEITYDKLYQYNQSNYLKLENVVIDVYTAKKKQYHIVSDLVYTFDMANMQSFYLSHNAEINDFFQNISIKGELLFCDFAANILKSDHRVLVIKDGFEIESDFFIVQNNVASFTGNVVILNKTGVLEDKKVDEFVNLSGNCENAYFYLNENKINMVQNVIIVSDMLDIKGDEVDIARNENITEVNPKTKQNVDKNKTNNLPDTSINILNGYMKYNKIDRIPLLFYTKGKKINFIDGNKRSFSLQSGDGFYISGNETNYFSGTRVFFEEEKLKDNSKNQYIETNKGYLKYEKNIDNEVISLFYSKGDRIVLVNKKEAIYKCYNGYGYIKDKKDKNELLFEGNFIEYNQGKYSKIEKNAALYDFSAKIFIKGDLLEFFDKEKIASSSKPFFLRQFKPEFEFNNMGFLSGKSPNIGNYFLSSKDLFLNFRKYDIQGNKGTFNTEDSAGIVEGNSNIVDYENLIETKSDKAKYTGNKTDIYILEGNLFVYQYESIEKILNRKYLLLVVQADKGKIERANNYGIFEGEPKIRNFEDKYFIKSDLLELYLDTDTYVFKDNVKLILNSGEDESKSDNLVFILGTYAVFESQKNNITFSGPSTLIQKNMEIQVSEIFVNLADKKITFKSLKDSKLKSINY